MSGNTASGPPRCSMDTGRRFGWKNLPKDYPNHNSVYYYSGKWRDGGAWQRVNVKILDK